MQIEVLDPHSLLHICTSLTDIRDLLHLGQTCRTLEAVVANNVLWSKYLNEDFGLYIESSAGVSLKKIYRALCLYGANSALRFLGVYTDGGCDHMEVGYWVDNMFIPNHWYPYCSQGGSNIHCVGLLQPGAYGPDAAVTEYRSYLIDRLKWAAARLFTTHAEPEENLKRWTTKGLERFFMTLYEDLQLGPAAQQGQYLLHGIAGPMAQELRRMGHIYQIISKRAADSSVQLLPVEAHDSLRLYDAKALRACCAADDITHTACVREVHISRAGQFTCPVAAGAVFLGQCRHVQDGGDSSQEERTIKSIELTIQQPFVQVLSDVHQVEGVYSAVEAGQLPPVIRHEYHEHGEWVEFEPLRAEEATAGLLRPVLWFRFYSQDEQRPSHVEADASRALAPYNDDEWELVGLGPADSDEEEEEEEEAEPGGVADAVYVGGPPEAEGVGGVGELMDDDDDEDDDDFDDGGEVVDLLGVAPGFLEAAEHWEDAQYDMEVEESMRREPDEETPQVTGTSGGGGEGRRGDSLTWGGEATSGIPFRGSRVRCALAPASSSDGVVDPSGVTVFPPSADLVDESTEGQGRDARLPRLHIPLSYCWSGNRLVVKLINQEDLMEDFGDNNESPNIDCEYVACRGFALSLPPSVVLR